MSKWLLLLALCGCEVIADFDRAKLDETRTIGPTPLPTLDGAVVLIPDATAPDGALIGPGGRDAGRTKDAAADAAEDAASASDAAGLDSSVTSEVDASEPDANGSE